MFKEETQEKLKECENYMYGSYITFKNLLQHKDHINFHEAGKIKQWLVELYENLDRLEHIVTSKAKHFEEMKNEQTRIN